MILSLALGIARLGNVFWHPKSFLVGGWSHPDNLGNHWLLVWVSEQLLHGKGILHNDRYYVPFGDYPWLAGNGSEGVLYLLFSWMEWPLGVVALILVIFLLSGMCTYLMSRALYIGAWQSLIPVSVVLSSPFLHRELSAGRFSQVDIAWLMGSIAGLLWLLRSANRFWIIWTGVFVACTGFFYWYYAFFFVLFAVISVLILGTRNHIQPIVKSAILSIICIAPIAWIYAENWGLIPGVSEDIFPSPDAFADSLNFTFAWFEPLGRTAGAVQSIPSWIFAIFAVIAVFQKNRSIESQQMPKVVFMALMVFLLFWLLAYGPKLPIFEWVYGWAPPLRRFWWPSRHLIMVNIAMSILAGVGWQAICQKWLQDHQTKLWMSIGCAVLIPFSFWLQGNRPFQALNSPVELPIEVYQDIADLEGDVLLTPPLSPKLAKSQAALLFQLFHHKRLLTGHALWVDRVRPTKWDDLIDNHVLLKAMQKFENGENPDPVVLSQGDLVSLWDLGVDWIVLDAELFLQSANPVLNGYVQVLTELFGAPILQKDHVWVFNSHTWTRQSTVSFPKWHWPQGSTLGDGRHSANGLLNPSKVLQDGIQAPPLKFVQ